MKAKNEGMEIVQLRQRTSREWVQNEATRVGNVTLKCHHVTMFTFQQSWFDLCVVRNNGQNSWVAQKHKNHSSKRSSLCFMTHETFTPR